VKCSEVLQCSDGPSNIIRTLLEDVWTIWICWLYIL